MPKIGKLCGITAVLSGIAVSVAGCNLDDIAGSAPPPGRPAPGVVVSRHIVPAALTIITSASAADRALALVRGTARPSEYLAVLAVDPQSRVLVASVSPPPVTIIARGKPTPPPAGASSFQQAQYRHSLSKWRRELTADRAAQTRESAERVRAWTGGLRLARTLGSLRSSGSSGLSGSSGSSGDLGSESAEAARERASSPIAAGTRRVVVMFVTSLAGRVPTGELTGADVLVVTAHLPSPVSVSSAQLSLVKAGAKRATVLGPQTSATQLATLVRAGELLTSRTKIFPGAALFANNSAILLPRARAALLPLVTLLRQPGTTAVINGYASTTGGRSRNQALSASRAAAVATFLTSHQVNPAVLTVIGHGSTGLTKPGPSPLNRRVVIVVTGPVSP